MGTTRLLGVFGHPVEHTLSPAMHNAAIAELGLDLVYCPFSVAPQALPDALRGMRAMGMLGVNLTIPHKEAALPLLDSLTDEARQVGAVNTVKVTDEGLLGHNTDPEGFAAPLLESGFDFANSSVVVLGAGGAARSVVYKLLSLGSDVVVVNRSFERARQLVQEIRGTGGNMAHTMLAEDVMSVGRAIKNSQLVVNTTSVGMVPNVDACPIASDFGVHSGLIVYDLIYRPEETLLLSLARRCGARTMGGLPMLVGQGAAAFSFWTGLQAPVAVMESAARRALNGS